MFTQRTVFMIGIFAAILINAAFLLYAVRHPDLSPGTGEMIMPLAAPVQKQAHAVLRTIRNCWRTYFALVSLAEENLSLRAELGRAEARTTRCTELEITNARLREILRLRRTVDDPVLAAEVIARDPSPWYTGITVSKGKLDGVRRGLPVLVPEGVAGLVSHVTDHYARILLLADPNSAVDAIVQRTRARGIVKGQSAGICSYEYVLLRHDIRKDDILISSGLDGIFPKGLRVGRVTEIMPVSSGIFQEIRVIPFANFERLEEVLIILLPPGDSPR